MANWTAKPTPRTTEDPDGSVAECLRIKTYFITQLGSVGWPSDRQTQELIFEQFWGVVPWPTTAAHTTRPRGFSS